MFLEMIFDKYVRELHDTEFHVVSTGTSSKTPVMIKQSNHHIVIQPGGNNFDKHIIRHVVSTYARTKPLDVYSNTKKFKVVLINEADKLSPYAQAALRRTMELYSSTCKFILCCNKLSGVIEPIRSRCNPIRVPNPLDGDIFLRLINISIREKVKFTLKQYTDIVLEANGRIKKSLWLLQIEMLAKSLVQSKQLMEECSIKPNIQKIVEQICIPNVRKIPIIRGMLYDVIVTNIEGSNIIMLILDELLKIKKLNNDKTKQLINIAEYYEHKVVMARRSMMHLEPFIQNVFYIINKNKLNKKL